MKRFFKIAILASVLTLSWVSVYSQITGQVTTDPAKAKYRANTIVYIEKASGAFAPPSKNPHMDQKNLTFIPRVLPILVGTTVDFMNSDDVLHNVFCPDACAKFDLGQYPKGVIKTHKYDKVGCQSVVLCNVHPEMEAYVVVMQNPYYAVTDKEGNFKIPNVPPGKYTLSVWNEKLNAAGQSITVPASGSVMVNFSLAK